MSLFNLHDNRLEKTSEAVVPPLTKHPNRAHEVCDVESGDFQNITGESANGRVVESYEKQSPTQFISCPCAETSGSHSESLNATSMGKGIREIPKLGKRISTSVESHNEEKIGETDAQTNETVEKLHHLQRLCRNSPKHESAGSIELNDTHDLKPVKSAGFMFNSIGVSSLSLILKDMKECICEAPYNIKTLKASACTYRRSCTSVKY